MQHRKKCDKRNRCSTSNCTVLYYMENLLYGYLRPRRAFISPDTALTRSGGKFLGSSGTYSTEWDRVTGSLLVSLLAPHAARAYLVPLFHSTSNSPIVKLSGVVFGVKGT